MSLIETVSDVNNTFLSRRELTCNFAGLGGKLKKIEAIDMISKEFKLDGKVIIPIKLQTHAGKPLITGTFYVYDDDIGLGMFGRALEKIGDFTGMYHDIDVDRIRKLITNMRKTREVTRFQV